MKIFLLAIATFFTVAASAQVTKVSIQATGLTCSMCSNSINKALKSLDFVEKVDANIQNSTFDVYFKPNATVDFDKLKKKVEDAGFFVAGFTAVVHFNNVAISNDEHVIVDGTIYHFLNVKDQTLNGDETIHIIDKGFVTAKEYKKNAAYTTLDCYKTGVVGSCCTKEGLVKGSRIYHVTI
jgi:copper chaperone CopZ